MLVRRKDKPISPGELRAGCAKLLKKARFYVLFTIAGDGRINLGGNAPLLSNSDDKTHQAFLELAKVVEERLDQICKMRVAWARQDEQAKRVQAIKEQRSKEYQKEDSDEIRQTSDPAGV